MNFFESIAYPLIARGWKVAPCWPGEKIVHADQNHNRAPLVPKPLLQMSRSLEQIQEWSESEPEANVCVYAEQVIGGLCFLDKDGERDIRAEYEKETGRTFQTFYVRSSLRNGIEKGHWYFLQTEKTIKLASNISESATGGWFSFRVKNEYVCSIGSIHPITREPYRIVDESPLIPIPGELVDWLYSKRKSSKKSTAKAADKIDKLAEGTRYTALITEVGLMWSRGWSRELVIKTGIEWARNHFQLNGKTFSEKIVRSEIEHLVDSYAPGAIAKSDTDKTIKELNDDFYVVENFGGKCVICWEDIDPITNSIYLGHQSFHDFENRYMHLKIKVGEKKVNGELMAVYKTKAKYWLDHPARRQYKEVVYAPGEEPQSSVRNLWRGFSVEAIKGDCSLYLDHIKNNICKGEDDKYGWLICWMAWKARNPGKKNYTCPVFKGSEGVGKNVAFDGFAYLWGSHAITVTHKEHVAGHFNAHLRACSLLGANEAFFAGDRQHESSLKGLITDEYFMVEAKGVDAIRTINRMSIIVMSNETWVIPAGPEARRFAVFDCGNNRKEDTSYFGILKEQLNAGGHSALLYHLLNEVNLSNFDERKVIRTEALAEQQALSYRGANSLWFECLCRGELPGAVKVDAFVYKDDKTTSESRFFITSTMLLEWARRQQRREWEGLNSTLLGMVLSPAHRNIYKGMGFQKVNNVSVGGERPRGWLIPPLRECRDLWNERRSIMIWDDNDHEDKDEWVIVKTGNEKESKKQGEWNI